MASVFAYIDGVDYGPTSGSNAVQSLHAATSGVDKVGTARINTTWSAASLPTLVMGREVQIYATGASPVGYFGGFVMSDQVDIWEDANAQRFVTLNCVDYNILLDIIVRNAAAAQVLNISAGTMATQITALVQAMQQNGHGSVSKTIDTISYVTNLTGGTVLPAISVSGESLRQGLRKIMANAILANSALRPRFNLQLLSDGAGGVTCALVVWDGASPGSSIATFALNPTGFEKRFRSLKEHNDASGRLTNYRQSIWTTPNTVRISTYTGATSGGTYFHPYMNDGIGTGLACGYFKDLPVKDTTSTSSSQAQNNIDMIGRAKEYPRQTYIVEEDGTYIRAGQGVTLKTDKINALFEVSAVGMEWPNLADPTLVRYKLSCGLPLLELFDDGYDGIAGPPLLGDTAAPLPPTSFSVASNVYEPQTGHSLVTFTIGASPSPDVSNYLIVDTAGPQSRVYFVGTNTAPVLEFMSGQSCSFLCYAQDNARPPNTSEEANGGTPVSITTATSVYNELQNPDFDNPDRLDGTLPMRWARTVVGGSSAATRDTTVFNTGTGSAKLVSGGSIGNSAMLTSAFAVVRGATYGLTFWAKSSVAATSVKVRYNWYDGNQALISTTTITKSLTTSFARYTSSATAAAGSAFYKMDVLNDVVSRTTYVDTITSVPQLPNDGLEAGAVTADKTFFQVSSVVPLPIKDENGDNVVGLWWSQSAHRGVLGTLTNPTYSDHGWGLRDAVGTEIYVQNGISHIFGQLELQDPQIHTSTFTVDTAPLHLANSASAITANLPSGAAIQARVFMFKNINTGTLTIKPYQQETIDYAYAYRLTAKNQWVMLCNSAGQTNWVVMASGVGGAEWRPTTPSGLKLWTPTDVLAGNDGDAIGTLSDQSGLGNNLTQATGANKPLLKTGANGQNGGRVLLFDGSNDYLANTGFTAFNSVGSFTAMLVFKTGDVSGNHGLLWKGGDGKFVQIFGSNLYVGDGNAGYGHFAFTDTASYHTLVIEFDGSLTGDANRLKCWLDGVSKTLTFDAGIGTTCNATNGIWLGSNHNQAVFHQGQVADLAMWTTKLSASDRATAETFFRDKWGI
jgi:hypothetical protein